MLRNYFYNICSWAVTALISILEKQKQFVEIFRTFTVFIFLDIKSTVQEFEQNQCHDIIRSSEMNMLFNK